MIKISEKTDNSINVEVLGEDNEVSKQEIIEILNETILSTNSPKNKIKCGWGDSACTILHITFPELRCLITLNPEKGLIIGVGKENVIACTSPTFIQKNIGPKIVTYQRRMLSKIMEHERKNMHNNIVNWYTGLLTDVYSTNHLETYRGHIREGNLWVWVEGSPFPEHVLMANDKYPITFRFPVEIQMQPMHIAYVQKACVEAAKQCEGREVCGYDQMVTNWMQGGW